MGHNQQKEKNTFSVKTEMHCIWELTSTDNAFVNTICNSVDYTKCLNIIVIIICFYNFNNIVVDKQIKYNHNFLFLLLLFLLHKKIIQTNNKKKLTKLSPVLS